MPYYFAYGSNLSRRQLEKRCRRAQPVFRAVLRGHKMVFQGPRTKTWGEGGVSNIVPCKNSEVWGGVYEVTPEDLACLDKCEGKMYKRKHVSVQKETGEDCTAETYVRVESFEEGIPSPEYCRVIRRGYKDWNLLPKVYESLVHAMKEETLKTFEGNLVSFVLYGSLARGDIKENSDIDLFLVCENLPRGPFERRRLIYPVEKKISEWVWYLKVIGFTTFFSVIVKTRKEAERFRLLYLDMTEDAKILYDKEGFFDEVLERLRVRLKELGSQRIRIGDTWYWDLKPDYTYGEVFEI